jgi:hypothetical protein
VRGGEYRACRWTEDFLFVSDKRMIHSVTVNIRQFKHCNSLVFISLFEGLMFSRWIVMSITSARRTVHCRKTRILCGDQLLICGQYTISLFPVVATVRGQPDLSMSFRSLPPSLRLPTRRLTCSHRLPCPYKRS